MNPDPQQTLLATNITVQKYREFEQQQDKNEVAKFVYQRFHERYIKPFDDNENKNGFIMMASACLMIEALESFWNGWKKSPNSALAFCQFFDRNDRFILLRGFSQEFYKHVRCGIMHQGETTGGWLIRRNQSCLFDRATLTIDANVFLEELERCLLEYKKKLEESDWNADVWKKFRKKMRAICDNTSPAV
jgi:hypothetical protein